MKTNILKCCAAALVLAGGVSCTDLLDMTPTNLVSDKTMWEKTENAEWAINSLYTYVYSIVANQSVVGLTESLTDMMKYGSYNYNSLAFIPSEFAYGEDHTIKAGYVDSYMGYWGTRYSQITNINEAFCNLKKYGKMSDADKTRLEAEIRFMRAYVYFDLVKRYKEVIIYDENMEAIVKDKALSTEAQAWDFIQADFDFAAANLPEKSQAKGRLDKGAAYAFLTRAMLYAQRYDAVITASNELKSLGYDLEKNYADSYSKTIASGNIEAILQYLFSRAENINHTFDFYYTPGGDFTINGASGGGYGTPTQELVESYELATGGFPDWSIWHDVGVTQTPPYALLEPRFHATVLYNGSQWKGREIQPWLGGADGFCEWNVEPEPDGRTTTGYYLRKMVDETHNVIQYTSGVQPFTVIRYAEVLLNRAEALYKTGKEGEANDIVNKIRDRVGLPALSVDGEELMAAIRQERKVEFAFEGLWYWDLRRWGIAHEKYPLGLSDYMVHGFKITKDEEGNFTYDYISVDDQKRNFPQRLYRFPLPAAELNNNGSVNQFPEWK